MNRPFDYMMSGDPVELRRAGVFVGLLLLCCAPGRGCDIPVFQYALEFWEADPYRVTIFHRGSLSEDDQTALALLRNASDPEKLAANLQLTAVDLEVQLDDGMQELWSGQSQAELPWMVVQYPPETRLHHTVWSGPFAMDSARQLLDSPARREIARRLVERKTAVWALLESGRRRADAHVKRLLEAELRRMEQTLRLPVMEEWGPPAGEDDPTVSEDESTGISFSHISLSRDDPDEQMLIAMLLHSEPDLDQFSDQPMAFPIYGRGRVVYALVGEGIHGWSISEAGEFLTSPCSCEVKALNPGTDLLMSVNWDRLVEPTATQSLPPLAGMGDFGDRAAQVRQQMDELDRQVAGGDIAPKGTADGTGDHRHWAISWPVSLAAGLLLALGMFAWRKHRRKRVEESNHEHLAS